MTDQPDTDTSRATDRTEATDPAGGDAAPHDRAAPPATPAATGVVAVDEAAQRLDELDDAPVEAHVGIYEDVHRRLQEGLADLDEQ